MKRRTDEQEKLIKRLKRVEGQVRGIQKMVEEEKYCIDILTQISAAEGSLKKVAFELLEEHTKHCVYKSIANGDGEKEIAELLEVMKRFGK